MARLGNFEYRQLVAYQKKIKRGTSKAVLNQLLEECAKALAVRFLQEVIPITPVQSGDLQRGWTGGQEVNDLIGYVNSVPIKKAGKNYYVDLSNIMHYASWVNDGHGTKSSGWVPGRFMLEIASDIVDGASYSILEPIFLSYLQRYFG